MWAHYESAKFGGVRVLQDETVAQIKSYFDKHLPPPHKQYTYDQVAEVCILLMRECHLGPNHIQPAYNEYCLNGPLTLEPVFRA